MGTRNAVCLCTDSRMLIPALFVAAAVKERLAESAHPADIIVFTTPSDALPAHRRWMAERGIRHCDDLDTSRVGDIAIQQERLSSATLMKLLLAEHLAGRYDRILYLDADVTIHDDVAQIFALDTGAFALAAVPAGRSWASKAERRKGETHFHALGMTEPYRYFNTGVLYIDTDKWNTAGLGARALAFIRENPELCHLPDEDALNAVLDGRFAELSPIWNAAPSRRGEDHGKPVIIHHMGEDKPWKRFGYRKRLFADRTVYRQYESFLSDTPWPRWLDEQWTLRDLRKNIVWEIRRITRRLRGKSDEPPRRRRPEHIEAARRDHAETRFVDVDQGIVTRENGMLRLRRGAA